eukprot:TRINITY_DN2505_c0_g1_i2.p1 TRINITY_DN2505_c0_g1~~TRINITY_DN2505_c0_g1_i2.p1  ORF type:complete len:357 (-),score=118.32 TRINITY_DN2505_c0_g1_i2:558-1628(-)
MSQKVALLATAAVAVAVIYVGLQRRRKDAGRRTTHTLAWTGALEDIPENEPVLLMECNALVGEGVFWDAKTQALHWVDIEGRRLYRLRYQTREVVSWELPKRASMACLREGAESDKATLPLLMGFEDGFALYNPETRATQYLPGDYVQEGNIRLNDGRCDRQGRLVCGGVNLDHIDEALDVWHATVSTYQIGEDMRANQVLPGPYRCYNATSFSPDGRTMYMADTPSKQILAYDYDPMTGNISGEPRVLKEFTEEEGNPDGATVDASGNVWVAEFWAGRVNCIAPDGSTVRRIEIPHAKRTTCCCIGGPQLDTLFITSACIGLTDGELKEQPWAGGLMAIKLGKGFRGIPEARFFG